MYANEPTTRLEGYNESELYRFHTAETKYRDDLIRKNNGEHCLNTSHIYHYQTDTCMAKLPAEVKSTFPEKYRQNKEKHNEFISTNQDSRNLALTGSCFVDTNSRN
mmetsp:Transcript_12693/g.29491  ORF Transcript_12693/g.29491 Transcript_12693/m.29491 type:complete len:106 (-) Transcript_12693:90-407(-)